MREQAIPILSFNLSQNKTEESTGCNPANAVNSKKLRAEHLQKQQDLQQLFLDLL